MARQPWSDNTLALNGADEAGRLEAALERIARASARAAAPAPAPTALPPAALVETAPEARPDTRELAARLDMLIEELRGLLGQT
jgi:hypothetical protein